MISAAVDIAFVCVTVAMTLNLYRVLRGPDIPDRIVGLDTLFTNTIALLMLLSIELGTDIYFEVALLIAMLGFIGTVALCRYVLRGDVIE